MDTKPKTSISIPPQEAAAHLIGAPAPGTVADVLEVDLDQLLHILYRQPVRYRYQSFTIPKKSGGVREIDAPLKGTAILQAKLKPILEEIYHPRRCAHGFIEGRGILSNAKKHTKKRYVFNLDLNNFYGHINFGRVRGLFKAAPFNMSPEAATVLAQLCTLNNRLPQGSPTSPVISNLIASDLDKRLMRIAEKHRLRYTRYADDITFSATQRSFPEAIARVTGDNPHIGDAEVGRPLNQEIESAGFSVNRNKVRMQIRGVRQEVTGLTVNEFPNVDRRFIRRIRAQIHSWRSEGIDKAAERLVTFRDEKSPPDNPVQFFKDVVYGKIAYLKMIRGSSDSNFIKYCLEAALLDPDPPRFVNRVKQMHEQFDVFICHASEDKDEVAQPIAKKCEEVGVNAFLDVNYISWGDSLTEKINHALGQAKFVVAILSEKSVDKAWPAKEINSALAREIGGEQMILPLLVGAPDLGKLPLLSDKLYLTWDGDADDVVEKLREKVTGEYGARYSGSE